MADTDGQQVESEPYGRTKPNFNSPAILYRNIWPRVSAVRTSGQYPIGPTTPKNVAARALADLNRDVTALGWFSWLYSAIYSPVAQIIWVSANVSRHDNGMTKIVKGMTIAITALPLCIDCRVRYADSLKYGRLAFNLIHSLSCLLQGVICTFLLVRGVIDAGSDIPLPLVVVYPVVSVIWMIASFAALPMMDGGRKRAGQTHWAWYILDVGMGAFAGVFLAAPAFGLYSSAQFNKLVAGDHSSGMDNIALYLECESQVWKKFAAVAP